MKKSLLMFGFALMATVSYAQDRVDEFGIFDHVGVGMGLGTTGIDFEVAAPIGDFFQLLAGYSFLPETSYKYKSDIDYTKYKNAYKGEIEGHVKWGNAKVMLDYYPMRGKTFHATIGAYIGSDEVADAKNIDKIINVGPDEGIVIGDYLISPDADGYAKAAIKMNKFKPYIGIGFGRSVPRRRIAFGGDFGIKIWGKPSIYEKQSGHDVKVESQDIDDRDGGIIKSISKISIWPVLTLRLTGRIF